MDIYLWVLLVSDCEGQHRIFNRVETKEAKVLEGNTSAVTWGSLKTRVFFFFFFIILAFFFFGSLVSYTPLAVFLLLKKVVAVVIGGQGCRCL